MKAQALIFDIDDTLYDSTRQSTLARAHAVEAMVDAGLDESVETVGLVLQGVIADLGPNHAHHFDELLRRLGQPPSPHLVAAAVVAYHNIKMVYLLPFEETVPTLLRLKDRGYRLAVVTDGMAAKQWEKLIRLGLQHFFEVVVISGEVGVEKPDPRLFATACQMLKLEPSACVYVGNHPVKDIGGARRHGMHTVQMLRGKYSTLAPAGPEQVPHHRIRSLRELLRLADAGQI